MKSRSLLVAALLAATLLLTGMDPAFAEDWQVVLLKPRGCGTCGLVEEILKRNAQLQRATLEDGAGGEVEAAIQRRASSDLTDEEWTQLRAVPGFDETHWRARTAAQAALVLLKRDGVIVAAGDIMDSADLRNARYPIDLTTPNADKDPGEVRGAHSQFIRDLYLRSWNLNWFYQVALHPELAASRSGAAWLSANPATLTQPLGAANVMLMSTASGAADNEIFNALRIEEIRDILAQSIALDPSQLRIFYGSDNAVGPNALEVRGGRIGLVRRNVAGSTPFSPDAAQRIFQSIRAQPGSHNLLVLIGHGNPEGAGMWGSPMPLSPETLHAMHDHGGGDDVLVSGNCFGGVMARAMSCGFFGARPDIVATGCQADAADVAQSRDYLHVFFSSLTSQNRGRADVNDDGDISFAEAHWSASIDGDERNITYTSIDALADAWFDAHADTA
ncbi:MAG: hypothetical protein LBE59_00205, partial [Nevskiaceae bacterium]|nr:hypothetical protein [Nevskiaceae bacterium]